MHHARSADSLRFVPRSVAGNNLKGSGAAFGEALKANSSLKGLGMQQCSLGPEDAEALAAGLAANTTLAELK